MNEWSDNARARCTGPQPQGHRRLHRAGQRLGHAFAVVLGVITPQQAQAQFAIDKTELVLPFAATSVQTGILLVRNEGPQRAQAVLRVEDWDRAPDGTNRFYPARTLPASCAPRLQVFPQTVSLAPGEAATVRVDLAPGREGTSATECWSVVLVESVQPRVEPSGRTLLYTLRTGLKVYGLAAADVPDGLVTDLQLTSRASESGLQDSAGPAVEASVSFRNTGDRHVVTRGWLEVRRDDTMLIATVPLAPLYALPQATMRTMASLPALPSGRYQIVAVIDYGGTELAAAQRDHVVP